jgi:hypothetical protein
MSTFEFTVILQGSGDTKEEAWADAVDAFCADPGEPSSTTELEEDSEGGECD